jgi:Cu/Ag efflux pump CusA
MEQRLRSLLVITVSFAPVFTLEAQEGRLFKPLVYTYTFCLAAAALLSVTLVPVLMMLLVRRRILPEQKNPLNRFLIWLYRPVTHIVLRWRKITIELAVIVLAVSAYPSSTCQRVHADPQRRDPDVHAGQPAQHVDHQGVRADGERKTRSSKASPSDRCG